MPAFCNPVSTFRTLLPRRNRTMRLSAAAVRYAKTSLSREYCGETANPSKPPSPTADTPGTVMTVRGLPPFAGIRRIFPVVRSATSASPPGRNAIPHGTWSSVDTVRRVGTRGDAVGVADADADVGVDVDVVGVAVARGDDVADGAGVGVASRDEEPHPARPSAAAATEVV